MKLPDEKRVELEKDLLQIEFTGRGAIVQALLGLGVLAGLYFTWRNVQLTFATLQTTQKGQVTERFTRAIDQLGATNGDGGPNREVRLGGIYGLEGVAKDSSEYHGPVMEVLTAYVRMNAPRATDEQDVGIESGMQHRVVPSFDVQAILTVLGKRKRPRLDLSATNLRGADLHDAFLHEANLRDADLRSALLAGAQLQEADLRGAILPTDLRNGQLQGAKLGGACLSLRDLSAANLQGADLFGVHLQGAILERANLREAILHGESHLERVKLSGADLGGASLNSAFLEGADFRGVKVLDGADLGYATLNHAKLQGVDLRKVKGLSWNQVAVARINRATQLPADVQSTMPQRVRTALGRQAKQALGLGLRPADLLQPGDMGPEAEQDPAKGK